jgi:hypothetical protein
MMFGLKGYIFYVIIISLIVSSAGYFVSNYFNLKAAYKISQQQLYLHEHRRVRAEQAMVRAEEELYKNLELQRNALYEIQHSGHLSGASNPTWMLQYQTPSN